MSHKYLEVVIFSKVFGINSNSDIWNFFSLTNSDETWDYVETLWVVFMSNSLYNSSHDLFTWFSKKFEMATCSYFKIKLKNLYSQPISNWHQYCDPFNLIMSGKELIYLMSCKWMPKLLWLALIVAFLYGITLGEIAVTAES